MDTEAVSIKARELMEPMLGAERTRDLIQCVNALEALKDVRELRPLLANDGH
jgi:hypothetical protein